jgi:hypothetical protein
MTCTCDMWPDPHPAGQTVDGITCEKAIPGPTISPHLMDAINKLAQRNVSTAPALSESQQATLTRILHQTRASAHAKPVPAE